METIEDILREMQETSRLYLSGGNDSSSVFEMLSTYHDRIESAYKGLPGMWIVPAENAKLREENEQLKASLNHVRNLDKYKTADEASDAFGKMCLPRCCEECCFDKLRTDKVDCRFLWLYEEAEKER